MRVIGFIQLRIGIIGEPCECEIEPPGSINHGVSEMMIETRCWIDQMYSYC